MCVTLTVTRLSVLLFLSNHILIFQLHTWLWNKSLSQPPLQLSMAMSLGLSQCEVSSALKKGGGVALSFHFPFLWW